MIKDIWQELTGKMNLLGKVVLGVPLFVASCPLILLVFGAVHFLEWLGESPATKSIEKLGRLIRYIFFKPEPKEEPDE